MPKCVTRAAGRLDRGGDDVGLVGDRRGAEGDEQVGALARAASSSASRERVRVVRHAHLLDQRRAGGLQPLLEDAPRLVHHRRLQARQRRRREPDLQRPPRRDRQRRRLACAPPPPPRARGTRERDDLHRRHHAPGLDRREFRQRRDGQARIEAVQRVDRRAVDDEQPGRLRIEVAAAGAGLVEADVRRRCSTSRHAPRRLVLVHVAGLEPRRDDLARRPRRASRSIMLGA